MFIEQITKDQKRLGRLGVGVVGIFLAISYTIGAYGMPQGMAASPGPGLYPLGVGFVGIISAALVIVEALVTKQTTGSLEIPNGTQGKKVLLFLASLVALILALPILGQYISSSLYVFVFLKMMSPLGWWRSLIYGTAIGLAVSWIFVEPLSIQMPAGIW